MFKISQAVDAGFGKINFLLLGIPIWGLSASEIEVIY